MFVSTVPAAAIGGRLDAEHFDPEAVALDAHLRQAGNAVPIKALVNPSRTITNGVRGPEFASSEYRLVRLQDCNDWSVTFASCATISRPQFEANRRCRLQHDDVVVAIGGYLGNAAVVSHPPPAVIGQHSALLPFGHETPNDPRYLTAYLNSRYGAVQFRRWSRGIVQAGLNLGDIGDIDVPAPHTTAQRYVGLKVRQAEALRERATRLHREVRAEMDSVLPGLPSTPPSWNRVEASVLGDRLDPRPYRAHRLELRAAIKSRQHDSVESVATLRGGNPVSSDEFVNSGVPLIKNGDILLDGFAQPTVACVSTRFHSAQSAYAAEAGLVVVCLDGEIRAQFFLPEELPAHINQRVAMVSASGIRPELLTAWINHPCVQEQLHQWSVQITVEHISNAIVAHALIPRLSEALETSLAERILDARRARWVSGRLILAARLLVEALIERKLTEFELIAAAASPAADRALLSRLTTGGLDAPGDALFPDLESLEEILRVVETAP